MCLVKVREDPDIVVPYRVVHRHRRSHSPHAHATRVSRTVIDERPPPRQIVTTPAPLTIPPPQPVPVFVQHPPAPAPPPASHHHHHVYVSPSVSRSSISSSDRHSELVYRRELRREGEFSPARSSAYGERYETYRYVDPPPESPQYYVRSRSRSRSVERRRYYEEEPERVTRTRIVVEDGGRRREYRH